MATGFLKTQNISVRNVEKFSKRNQRMLDLLQKFLAALSSSNCKTQDLPKQEKHQCHPSVEPQDYQATSAIQEPKDPNWSNHSDSEQGNAKHKQSLKQNEKCVDHAFE